MARGKKNGILTPEERLQEALVPESEQPYPVPGNWCWIHLLDSFYNYTESKKKIPQKEYIKDGDIAVVDQGQDLVGGYTNDREMAFSGNLPVIIFGDHTRCIKYIDFPFAQGADGVKVLKPKQFFDAKAFYYAFQTVNIPNMGYRRHFPLFDQYTIPLPPLAEQQRIVDRIENLFSKLDEAKQKAQDALNSFEPRKAAILHKAFTGKLTARWRKEHGVGMESWKKSQFDEVATIKSNLVNPLDFPDLPHIAPDNIEKKTGVLLEYHTVSEDGVTSGNHRFYPGQILYSKIRPYLSKVVVVDFDGLCSADMYPIEAKENAKCLWYYMLSEEFLEQASSAGSRSVLPKINQKELSALTVVLPTLKDEQEEIVRILDDMFAKEQQARESTERVLEQIDLIKKAILARAFRGKLGTNDPREESAIKLLEQSFLETTESKKVRHKQGARQKAEVIFVPKTIMEALSTGVRLTPENLKRETELSIDDFYAQLKGLIDNGSVIESRENGESYLEAANEDRQAKNQ